MICLHIYFSIKYHTIVQYQASDLYRGPLGSERLAERLEVGLVCDSSAQCLAAAAPPHQRNLY